MHPQSLVKCEVIGALSFGFRPTAVRGFKLKPTTVNQGKPAKGLPFGRRQGLIMSEPDHCFPGFGGLVGHDGLVQGCFVSRGGPVFPSGAASLFVAGLTMRNNADCSTYVIEMQ
jgi:hypothetical protein